MRPLTSTLTPTMAALAALAAVALPRAAFAQEEVSPTGKGITGGALLGAETVMLVEAALDVDPAWAYIVGGVVGGVGGGVGGYFVEQGGDPKLSLYMLAGGMAFVIPTTVAVLSATAYEPPADYTEDRPPADEPVAEPPQPAPPGPAATPGASLRIRQRAALRRPVLPPALVGITDDALRLGVPAVEVRDAFSRREVSEQPLLAGKQVTEVRVPVLNVVF